MPKGHKDPYTTTCQACGEDFTTTRLGRAAWYCRRPECDEARGYEPPEVKAERRQRQVREREAKRQRKEAERARREQERRLQRGAAVAERDHEGWVREEMRRSHELEELDPTDKRVRAARLRVFEPILNDPNQMMYAEEILALAPLLRTAVASKAELKKAIVRLTHAQGARDTHARWLELAAVALRCADSVRPRSADRTPPAAGEPESVFGPPNPDVLAA